MDKKDLEREFHMTGGAGNTSYARNSYLQKKASEKAKHITLKTLQQFYKETRPKSIGIADLGCSSGPNTLSTIKDIIKAVEFSHHREIPNQPLPEVSIFLNDLPGNDFNSIFNSLPDFHTELKRDNKTGDFTNLHLKKASEKAKHITLKTLQQFYKETRPKSIGIADLGCSSGPNTLSTIKDIIKAVEFSHHREIPNQPLPEVSIFLNDLPGNDFNSIFNSLPDFHTELKRDNKTGDFPSVFIAAYPGSFYGRLFPKKSVHFIYSSYSLHWLSKVPPALYDKQGKSINKGCVAICSSSPEPVSKAYYSKFKEDFSLFLRCRSKELVATGRIVLIILGREGPDHVDRGNSFYWELLSRSIVDLVAHGETTEEKLDSYDMHFYAPSAAEIEDEVNKEGSFELERLEILEVDKKKGNEDNTSYGKSVAKAVRAIQEPMLVQHFGEEILDKLFDTYGKMVDEELAKEDIRPITFVVVLRKKI